MLRLFPLPNVVLFPDVLLPLHIFEPRYRQLTSDALDADRLIGMVLLRPGWEASYEERPPIYPIGCRGVIVHATQLDDGRYNIVVRGIDRIRIVEEHDDSPYRRATTTSLPDLLLDDDARQAVRQLRGRIETLLGLVTSGDRGAPEAERFRSMPDEAFVHLIAHSSDLETIEKQALIECDNLQRRAQMLVDLLEMRRLFAGLPGASGRRQ